MRGLALALSAGARERLPRRQRLGIADELEQCGAAGGERSLELALTGRIVHELEYEVLQLITRSGA